MRKTQLTSRVRIKRADIFDPTAQVDTIEPDRDFGREPERDVVCYTFYGQHDYLDADDNPTLMDIDGVEAEERDLAFAKAVTVNGRTRFFIKQGDNGRLFNPIGMTDQWTHNKFRHHTGSKQWNFVEVSPRAFGFYLDFLRTKNTAYHKNAEREAF